MGDDLSLFPSHPTELPGKSPKNQERDRESRSSSDKFNCSIGLQAKFI